MVDQSLPFHHESAGPGNPSVEQVFVFLDGPEALAAHLGESSMTMPDSHRSKDVDADGDRVIGSKVRMHARKPGIRLALEEVITRRRVPAVKVWETVGTPKLLVISHWST